MALFPTSYIKTTGARVTRAGDDLTFTLNVRPQALSLYVRFFEHGTVRLSTFEDLIQLSTVNPSFRLEVWSTSRWAAVWTNKAGATAKKSIGTAQPTPGDRVELLGTLTDAGVVQLIQSINGTDVTETADTAAPIVSTTLGNTTLRLGSVTTTAAGIERIVLARGVHTITTMRRYARVIA